MGIGPSKGGDSGAAVGPGEVRGDLQKKRRKERLLQLIQLIKVIDMIMVA